MEWFWTWGGEGFGYRRNDRLFAYYGLQVGRFHGDEVYGSDGRYLGELKSRNRLITNVRKKGRVRSSFAPVLGGSYARYVNYVGNVMYVGHEDFPAPDEFR